MRVSWIPVLALAAIGCGPGDEADGVTQPAPDVCADSACDTSVPSETYMEPIAVGIEVEGVLYEDGTLHPLILDDGTPKTKHITSNAIIEVDEEAGTATCRSYYTVLQATDDLPLQPIVTGRYHDTFHRVAGEWWFDTRVMFIDQTGDLSHHLTQAP